MRFRIASLTCLAAAAAASMWATSKAQQRGEGPISSVLELYTSQGCSSCPPADKLLGQYAGRSDVLALSFNVDIWDNLGWKDTLARPEYSERQRAYAKNSGDGKVYTPQAIVNGAAHTTGSDKNSIDALLKGMPLTKQEARAEISVRVEGDGVLVEATAVGNGNLPATTCWLVKLTPKVDVQIVRGENAGKSVSYHNAVREMIVVGEWTGTGKPLRLGREALAGCKPATCAVMVQRGRTGSILGAAWLPSESRL